jgi:deoxycytidine triphosphate deaminase
VRCADEFKVFTNIIRPSWTRRTLMTAALSMSRGDVCIIPPNSFALARTVEYFRIPRSVLTICLGKSTYARCGIIVNVTPLEPEWEGHVTLEFSNTTNLPAKIYANEGVAQMLFSSPMRSAKCRTDRPRRQVSGPARRDACLEAKRSALSSTIGSPRTLSRCSAMPRQLCTSSCDGIAAAALTLTASMSAASTFFLLFIAISFPRGELG